MGFLRFHRFFFVFASIYYVQFDNPGANLHSYADITNLRNFSVPEGSN